MKKFAIAMMAALAMFAGSACSGSASSPTTKIGASISTTTISWSDVDKAALMAGIVDINNGKGHLMTQSQQMCVFDWFTSHYKSMDEVKADTTSPTGPIEKACDL